MTRIRMLLTTRFLEPIASKKPSSFPSPLSLPQALCWRGLTDFIPFLASFHILTDFEAQPNQRSNGGHHRQSLWTVPGTINSRTVSKITFKLSYLFCQQADSSPSLAAYTCCWTSSAKAQVKT
eukprot:1159697-Pelagomonas_calceolata.AAC.9